MTTSVVQFSCLSLASQLLMQLKLRRRHKSGLRNVSVDCREGQATIGLSPDAGAMRSNGIVEAPHLVRFCVGKQMA